MPSSHTVQQGIPTTDYTINASLVVTCLDSGALERRLSERPDTVCGVTQAVSQHSDLIPNVYEG